MRLRRGKIEMALAVALCGLVVMGMAHSAQAATGFIDSVVSLPAPDGLKAIRTFDYRSDGAALVTGPGVTLAAFLSPAGIPVGTPITAVYQSDVGIFTNAGGATVATNVGNAGSYEITAVATLTGTVVITGPASLGVLFSDVKARMYLQNPGNRTLLAGTGYQDGSLILAAHGTSGSASVLGGSGGASATMDVIDFCGGGVIVNCSSITDFHFNSTLNAPATGGGAGTTAWFAVPPACTGGAFCFAPVAKPVGGLVFDADAFGRATGNIPGPATLWLIGSGLLGVAGVARLRRKSDKAK
jgi:hypothetical protein